MTTTRLYVNDSADSEEGIRLLKEVGIDFQLISANGHSMPVLLIDDTEFAGLGQIRLYLRLLKAHQEG